MYSIKILVVLLVSILFSGCQVKPDNVEPIKLSSKEISALFVGKTVESFNLKSGSTSFTYYYSDGKVEQDRFWEKRVGLWKINDKSEICLAMEGKPFSCRNIFKQGEKYYKYRKNNEGQLEKLIRYRQFISGKVI